MVVVTVIRVTVVMTVTLVIENAVYYILHTVQHSRSASPNPLHIRVDSSFGKIDSSPKSTSAYIGSFVDGRLRSSAQNVNDVRQQLTSIFHLLLRLVYLFVSAVVVGSDVVPVVAGT